MWVEYTGRRAKKGEGFVDKYIDEDEDDDEE